MRVITGSARGRKLVAPPGLDTRPTTDLVKEAVFSMIQFELEGARVLDLFAGSGQMGIEALSRGAASCTFVDTSPKSHQALLANLKATGFQDIARVVTADAAGWLRSAKGPFDIAFLDPPYGSGHLVHLLPLLADQMSESGVILCEHESGEALLERAGLFEKYRTYRYGKSKITQYRRTNDMAEQES